MKYKNILLGILISLFFCDIYGQTTEENLAKYWRLRERLVQNYITEIGDGPAKSLPASERLPFGVLKYGDTPAYLSMYISTLVTEYYLLTQSNLGNEERTRQTIIELFYAMEAFNRLDRVAEPTFGPNLAEDLNGFFIRDDVPASIMTLTVQSKLNTNLTGTMSDVTVVSSDFTSATVTDKEESKDQVLWMLHAMKFVREYIPPSLVCYENGFVKTFSDGQISINEEAKKITERMIEWMRNNSPNGWEWIIVNPVTYQRVARGYDGYTLSYGIAKAYESITGNSLSYSWIWQPYYNAARTIWDGLENNQIPYSYDEDFKVELLVATGNSWPVFCPSIPTCLMWSINPTLKANLNFTNLENRCNSQFNWAIPTLHIALHQPSLNIWRENQFRWHLDDAQCDNFYNYGFSYGANYYSNYPYCVSSWILHSRYNLIPDFFTPTFPGDFNGLDYMLMHNLYYMRHLSEFPPYTDKIHTIIHTDFPIYSTAPNIGSVTNPFTLISWGDIVADNTVFVYGDVTYRASTSIELLPGFEAPIWVQPLFPTTFTAYIDPLECNSFGEVEKLIPFEAPNQTSEEVIDVKMIPTNELTIYPNPHNNEITIVLPEEKLNGKLQFYDLSGREIYNTETLGHYYKITTTFLNPGVYYIKYLNLTKKIIKL